MSNVKSVATKSVSSESDINFDECDDLVGSTTSEGEFFEVEEVFDAKELKPVKKDSFIPKVNHIACEPEHYVMMYQLKGSQRVYSDEEFPIENVNPSKIGWTFRLWRVIHLNLKVNQSLDVRRLVCLGSL